MRKFYLLYFFIAFLGLYGFGQSERGVIKDTIVDAYKDAPPSYEPPYQDNKLNLHQLPATGDSMFSRRAQKKYRYSRNLDSLLHAWKNTEEGKMSKNTGLKLPFVSLFGNGFIRIFIWALAIAFVAFILFKLFLNKGLFSRESSNTKSLKELTEEELFFGSDYDILIHKAVLLSDYRVAIRYYFLKTLFGLNEKHYVEYAIDKTNLKYYYELPAHMKADFLQLSRYYEFAWYGQVPVTAAQYSSIKDLFTQFSQKYIN